MDYLYEEYKEMFKMKEKMEFKELLKELIFKATAIKLDETDDDWILEPLIPTESIIILDGLGGSGKSWFALDVSFSISTGIKFLNRFPVVKPGPVLYFTAEETQNKFLKRLYMITATYGDNENFYWFSTLHRKFPYTSVLLQKYYSSYTKTMMSEAIEYYLEEVKPVLVVLDSLVNFYGLNENDATDATSFYDLIKGWIKTYQCSFLLLHHQNKESMRSDEGTFRGSIVFREQARERITYRTMKLQDKTTVRKITIEKANYYSPLLEMFPLYLRWQDGAHIYDEQTIKIAKIMEEAKERTKSEAKKRNNNKEKMDPSL